MAKNGFNRKSIFIVLINIFILASCMKVIEDNHVNKVVDKARFHQLTSGVKNGEHINLGGLSGLVSAPDREEIIYAVNDRYKNSLSKILTIDISQTPVKVIDSTSLMRDGLPVKKIDVEGITTDGQGGYWLVSEGKVKKDIPHALYHVNKKGELTDESSVIDFPDELLKYQRKYGAEGITRIGDILWLAIQRPWDDDPQNTVKLVAYHTKDKTWGAVLYPLEFIDDEWTGLSEITAHGDYVYIIERDNQVVEKSEIKRLYRVAKSELKPKELGSNLPLVNKELVFDLLPMLKKKHMQTEAKLEGLAIDVDGTFFFVTDDDGKGNNSAKTLFFSIHK